MGYHLYNNFVIILYRIIEYHIVPQRDYPAIGHYNTFIPYSCVFNAIFIKDRNSKSYIQYTNILYQLSDYLYSLHFISV